MSLSAPAGRIQQAALAVMAGGMVLTVGTALGFQHLAGYIPCKLCLEQRVPYYVGAPIMLVGLALSFTRVPATVTRGLLLVGALIMTWSLYLGVFHAGVEWSWWAGPADCGVVAAPTSSGGNGILDQLNAVVPPSCDEAAGRFLGLSFAGWNAVASLGLAIVGYYGAFARGRS